MIRFTASKEWTAQPDRAADKVTDKVTDKIPENCCKSNNNADNTPNATPKRTTDRVTDKVTDRVTDNERALLAFLSENPGYTMPQLSEKLGVSRKTVALGLKSLKENGIIERVGSDRKGYWKIKQ